jgi:hypothetical protein
MVGDPRRGSNYLGASISAKFVTHGNCGAIGIVAFFNLKLCGGSFCRLRLRPAAAAPPAAASPRLVLEFGVSVGHPKF